MIVDALATGMLHEHAPLFPMPTTERGGVGAWEPLRLDAADSSNCFSLCAQYEI